MHFNQAERDVVALSLALIDGHSRLSRAEAEIGRHVDKDAISREALRRTVSEICRGMDPLGAYLRSTRYSAGDEMPHDVVDIMQWWIAGLANPTRFTVLNAGTGQLLRPLSQAFPQSSFVAIENDPLTAIALRANLVILKLHRRTRIVCGYEELAQLPRSIGPVAYLGCGNNRPEEDESLVRTFDAIATLARPGDTATFVVPSDALEGKRGAGIWRRYMETADVTHVVFLEPRDSSKTRMAVVCACSGNQSEAIRIGFSRFPMGTSKPGANAWLNIPRNWLQDASCWSDFGNASRSNIEMRPHAVSLSVSLPD